MATYQLIVLVELTFKVIVICSISTEYKFSMDGLVGSYLGSSTVISGSTSQSDIFEATDDSGAPSFFIPGMARPSRHPLDPRPAYAVALGSPVCNNIPGLHCKSISFLSYLSDYSSVILWVDGHPVGITFSSLAYSMACFSSTCVLRSFALLSF